MATVSENKNAIDIATRSAGRFIIATNILEQNELGNDEMISEYKAQQSCERGFGFLKDPLFFADSIFLKSPERIQALAMIMGLCLLVYTLAQRQLRAALCASNSTVKNQLRKSINNPTLRWIFHEPKCTGMWGALATNNPEASKIAQEKSSLSLIFTDAAVF